MTGISVDNMYIKSNYCSICGSSYQGYHLCPALKYPQDTPYWPTTPQPQWGLHQTMPINSLTDNPIFLALLKRVELLEEKLNGKNL